MHVNCAIMAMLYTNSILNQLWNMPVVFKMRDSVPSATYSRVCNVLRLYGESGSSLQATYKVYRICNDSYSSYSSVDPAR